MNVADLPAILEPKLPKNPIVITTGPLLGLGDHGVYSTLAERFHNLGYEVYYDQDNAASNFEIYDLYWKLNPYLLGPSNLKPNAGYSRQGLFYEWANRLPGHRAIEAMERAHGLPPPYSMAPKIYYKPKPPPIDVSNTILVDFSAVSSKIAGERLHEHIRMMRGRFRNAPMMQILHPPHVVINQIRVLKSAYGSTSIHEYLDFIAACPAFVGSEAGGQTLASAVRGAHDVYDDGICPEVVCVSTRQTFNSRGYTYRNVDYRVTAADGHADYHDPLEVKVLQYENMCMIRRLGMENRRAG